MYHMKEPFYFLFTVKVLLHFSSKIWEIKGLNLTQQEIISSHKVFDS